MQTKLVDACVFVTSEWQSQCSLCDSVRLAIVRA